MIVETPRLRLRNWQMGDAIEFDRHTNTDAVMRWLGGVRTPEQVEEVVARFIAWQEARGFTFWVVERKTDGAMLGFCGLKIADGEGSTVLGLHEVGWRFRQDCWGQGYAKEAATAALDHAFRILDVPRLIALTVQGNSASWGLMLRLGMTRREELDYVDPRWPEVMNPVIVYSLEKDQWLSRTS